MSKNLIISVAVRKPYTDYAVRLKATCEQFGVEHKIWIDEYPPGSRSHHESLYGFKCHAIFNAMFEEYYDNVLWLDSACYLTSNPDIIFRKIEREGLYLIHGDDMLINYINAPVQSGYTPIYNTPSENSRLLSGSFIGVNYKHEDSNKWLSDWSANEALNGFGSAENDRSDWRHDESVGSLIRDYYRLKSTHYADSHFQSANAIVRADKW